MKDFNKKELAWIKRFQKLIDNAPNSLSMFCEGNGIIIFKSKELPRDENGYIDASYPYKENIDTDTIDYDAGAW